MLHKYIFVDQSKGRYGVSIVAIRDLTTDKIDRHVHSVFDKL